MKIALLDVVRVIRDIPESSVVCGMVGTVVMVFEIPERAFEIEFVDRESGTLMTAVLREEDIAITSGSQAGEDAIVVGWAE